MTARVLGTKAFLWLAVSASAIDITKLPSMDNYGWKKVTEIRGRHLDAMATALHQFREDRFSASGDLKHFAVTLQQRDDTLAPPESLLIAALRESSPDVINDPYALYGAQRIVVEYRPCTQPPSHNSKHACIASNATTASLLLCSAPSSVWPYWGRPGAAATSSLPMKSARSASSSSTTEATLSINGRSTAACLSRSSDRWQCVAASI